MVYYCGVVYGGVVYGMLWCSRGVHNMGTKRVYNKIDGVQDIRYAMTRFKNQDCI